MQHQRSLSSSGHHLMYMKALMSHMMCYYCQTIIMSSAIQNETVNKTVLELDTTSFKHEFCSEVNLTITPKAETLTGPQKSWIGILPHREYNCNYVYKVNLLYIQL